MHGSQSKLCIGILKALHGNPQQIAYGNLGESLRQSQSTGYKTLENIIYRHMLVNGLSVAASDHATRACKSAVHERSMGDNLSRAQSCAVAEE